MILREFYKDWQDRPLADFEQAYPGPFLIVNWPHEESPWKRQIYPLYENVGGNKMELVLGRTSQCDIRIQESGVSSKHALLQRTDRKDPKSWVLFDLCSTNGTYTHHYRLTPAEPEILGPNQSIILGTEVQMTFLDFPALSRILAGEDDGSEAAEQNFDQTATHDVSTQKLTRAPLKSFLSPEVQRLEQSKMPHSEPVRWPRPNSEPASTDSGTNTLDHNAPKIDPDITYWLHVEGHEAQSFRRDKALVIGRSAKGTDLRLSHPLVSRRHVRLTVEKGQVFVEDLGSSNGTIVGTYDISGKKVPLDSSHTFWIGPFCLKVTEEQAEARHTGERKFTTQLRIKMEDKASMGITFSGEISESMPVSELLQGIEFNEKTGTLFIESKTCQGLVSFKQGRPLFAESHGEAGIQRGDDAVFHLLSVVDGEFSFAKETDDSEPNVTKTIPKALMDYARWQDEQSRADEA